MANLAGQTARRIEGVVLLLGFVAASLWGTSYVAAKYSVQWIPPFTAAAFRFLMVVLVLWIAALASGQRPRVKKGDWLWLALAGLFQTSFYFALQYAGIGLTSASNTAVIVNTRPIFVLLVSVLVLREKLTTRKIGAILIAFVGVLLITTNGSLAGLGLERDQLWGDFLIVLNALSGAVGLILVKRALGTYSPFHTLVLTATFGALGLMPFAAVELVRQGGIPATPPAPWLLLIYQAVFCSVVPHIMWNNVLAKIDASRAAVFFYVTPVVAVLLSAILLDESISIYLAVGAILVLSGVYLTMATDDGVEPSREMEGSS